MAANVIIRTFLAILLLVYSAFPFAQQVESFIIGTGDVLAVEVYNERDLTVRAKVGQSGKLRFPLLGDVEVVGKTPAELSKELEEAYFDGYLVNPSVSVVIESYRPFYIRGAVLKAGAYEFEYDLTVDQAIAIAGGLKDRASKSDWFVIRGPEKERIKVTKDAKVLPGDIIEIEESLF